MANTPMKARRNLPSKVEHHHCRYSFNYSLSTRENLGNDAITSEATWDAEPPIRSTESPRISGSSPLLAAIVENRRAGGYSDESETQHLTAAWMGQASDCSPAVETTVRTCLVTGSPGIPSSRPRLGGAGGATPETRALPAGTRVHPCEDPMLAPGAGPLVTNYVASRCQKPPP